MGDANLKIDNATGSTKPETDGEYLRSSAAANIAGSDAGDDRVLNPTTWAGAQARANDARDMRPITTASRYSTMVLTS